ncbi:hypothetical protein EC991_003703 [Linnemannia zychae]|nr:hypothetical protein EC991_003703 [Linnemannia zychae]
MQIDSLPAEAFQHICRFCTLHDLAALRTVSTRVRDLVDDSITSRKTFAEPYSIEPKDKRHAVRKAKPEPKHNPHSCYVHISLKRSRNPVTAVFTRYDKQHNYLEFTQKDPARVEIDYDNSTLGQLDFSNWEYQLTSAKEAKDALSISPPSTQDASSTTSRPRRSSITQAGPIRAAQVHMEQELNNGGPIPPMPTSRPILSSLFGSSTTPAAGTRAAAGTHNGTVFNHMAQYVLNTFGSNGPQNGMTTEQLTQEALQRFHSVDNEVLPSKKQYKFELTEGTHYIGDDNFIIRYTIKRAELPEEDETTPTTTATSTTTTATTETPADALPREYLEFKVDYIRASWRWISSGAPNSPSPTSQSSTEAAVTIAQGKDLDDDDDEDDDDDDDDEDDRQPWETLLNPLPDLRIGRMYAHRFNMVLKEIGMQGVTPSVRGELRNLGYDASLFPNKFIYANLRDEHVLEWVTEKHFEKADAIAVQGKAEEPQDRYAAWEAAESALTSHQQLQVQAQTAKEERDEKDRLELKKMVLMLERNRGYLTARNILEEMLACQGYSRNLIWKYGVVRREMMGPVPSQAEAKKLLTKVIDSEAASGSASRPRPSQF